tara:strand:- start:613 stop:723 length:111 start_codon:yes stop_codon:yes gene_type:complete
MRSILIEVLANEARKIRIWKWVAIASIALHLIRSFL